MPERMPVSQAAGHVSDNRTRFMAAAAVFVLSLAWFGWRAGQSGMASAYCDPVSRIGAQDDAVYGREAIEMAAGGHWLTPTYLGRYMLNKPPMLQWLAAACVRIFGASAWALRLPSLLAAALLAALVFSLVRRAGSLAAALGAALLLVSSHLFYVFARLAMTDMLLAFWTAAAIFTLARDPTLGRRSSFWMFAASAGAAILTKGAAGAVPLVALAIFTALAPRASRPSPGRIAAVFLAAAAVALPWHFYQLIAHPHWFIAEYILTQHLSVGFSAPPQYSNEGHLLFYARRLFLMDPALTLMAIASLPFVLRRPRRRALLLAWIAALLVALFGFRYRSGYYLLPLIPALAVLSAELLHALPRLWRGAALAALLACLVAKAVSPSSVWGIPAGVASQAPEARGLETYCDQHRGNGLILINSADRFYASDLPLARTRYCWISGQAPSGASRLPLDFAWLGISLPVPQFDRLNELLPVFRTRLKAFDLPSDAAVGTVILADSPGQVAHLIERHPEADFSLPETLLRDMRISSPHQLVPAQGGRVFLLSPISAPQYHPLRPCRL
jgi:hypothetical protein